MSKRNDFKNRKEKRLNEKALLITMITSLINLIIAIVELINKLID